MAMIQHISEKTFFLWDETRAQKEKKARDSMTPPWPRSWTWSKGSAHAFPIM